MNLLEVKNVSRAFGGLRAVEDVSLNVPVGSLTALIGPNGAGKTTLFALMSGFLRPDVGQIFFDGVDITGRAPHLNAMFGLTRTFQIVQPFASQTVRENIAVGAHLKFGRRDEALSAAEEVANRLGLHAQLDKPAADLTVAGRKRLELARALATQPKLLLLDEVLAGLNPQEIQEMLPVVRGLVDGGVTVLMILYPQLPLSRIVASDIAYAVPLTLVAGLGHASMGSGDWSLLSLLLAGSLPGIWIGSRLVHKAPERFIRSVLSVLLAWAGSKLVFA